MRTIPENLGYTPLTMGHANFIYAVSLLILIARKKTGIEQQDMDKHQSNNLMRDKLFHIPITYHPYDM